MVVLGYCLSFLLPQLNFDLNYRSERADSKYLMRPCRDTHPVTLVSLFNFSEFHFLIYKVGQCLQASGLGGLMNLQDSDHYRSESK